MTRKPAPNIIRHLFPLFLFSSILKTQKTILKKNLGNSTTSSARSAAAAAEFFISQLIFDSAST